MAGKPLPPHFFTAESAENAEAGMPRTPKTDMKEWNEFLATLDPELVKRYPLKVVRFDAGNLYLEADGLTAAWFDEHVKPLLKNFRNQNNRPIQVHLNAAGKKTNPAAQQLTFSPHPIDPSCTFANFVVFPGNAMAYKLLSQPTFNPIYLYGPKSSGKSHLLMALASTSKRAFYTTADAFTNHVVQAIRASSMQAFRKVYRDIDILLVDDIHQLSGRAATQEEFFHTFNALHTLGKQIVLSSSFPPSKLTDIEPRLISRFEWGIAMSLEKAEPLQIVQRKAALWNLSLPNDVIHFLTQFPDPVQALQALVLRTSGPITFPTAEKLLKDLLQPKPTPEQIVKSLATHFGIKPEDILGKDQSRSSAFPRQIAMYICREHLKMPFQAIGKIFSRDHSTVMSSVKQLEKTPEVLEIVNVLDNI